MTNLPYAKPLLIVNPTVMTRILSHFSGDPSTALKRILIIIVLAVLVHFVIKLVRSISEWMILKSTAQKNPLGFVTRQPKFITLLRLIVSGVTFTIYFLALGLILQEFGVNLTAYLASASVIGLAISFGSQGMVQDMVIGLTIIFSDAMDVGDMVEIFGATNVIGRVEEIGLRFTRVTNFLNQTVFILRRAASTPTPTSRFPPATIPRPPRAPSSRSRKASPRNSPRSSLPSRSCIPSPARTPAAGVSSACISESGPARARSSKRFFVRRSSARCESSIPCMPNGRSP